MRSIQQILTDAKLTARESASLSPELKNRALLAMADALERDKEKILSANAVDIQNATGVLPDVMLDRLRLSEKRITDMANGIREVAALPDPIGKVLEESVLKNGLTVTKKRVPLGVIGIIYESRPNVTSDAAALSLKSGNACVLRGGKEAFRSSSAIIAALRRGLAEIGMNENFVNIVPHFEKVVPTSR